MKPFESYFYKESTPENEGKIEPFSLGIGVAVGIAVSAGQALVHYIANPDSVAFLGMAFVNGLLSVVLGTSIFVITIRYYSARRKELLKMPEKAVRK